MTAVAPGYVGSAALPNRSPGELGGFMKGFVAEGVARHVPVKRAIGELG